MNQATADFIRQHADADVHQLALQGTKNPEVDLSLALNQIAGRQTARHKLPSWAAIDGIVYPSHLSMEQCSSEQTAQYKANIIGSGKCLIDLTGGFGVDFSYMARRFDEAIYVERQEQLCAIARGNFRLLGMEQAQVICCDSTSYLHDMDAKDVIYIDPARRDNLGGRTYALSDCTPNVLELRDMLLEKADRVLLKLSPMLDWRKAAGDIGEQHVREVHIVSAGNECKELLLLLGKGEGLKLVCVNDDTMFEVNRLQGTNVTNETYKTCGDFTPHQGTYIYEPNASIMKAGCFTELSQRYGICQLAQNSHLFASDKLMADFPGRTFVADTITPMNKHKLKVALEGITQANITVRNFPLSVAELRKRLKLSEGGSTYIFATTLASRDKVLFICRKA